MRNFQIFTMVWGEYHLKLFKRACFRSLNWPKNKAAIHGSTWNIYTKPEHTKEIQDLMAGTGLAFGIFEMGERQFMPGVPDVPTSVCDQGILLLNGLRIQMQHCLEKHVAMLFAPPDTIFGDGSIENILRAGQQPHSVVCAVHARVLPDILNEIEYGGATDGPCSNARLVDLSFKHAHGSWAYAEKGHAKNSTWVTGLLWERLPSGLVQVQHKLPTPYYVNFTGEDFNFWFGQNSFGQYDHGWPGECFIRQERQRLIGSSDSAFIVEVTDHDKNLGNIPQPPYYKQLPEDAYFNHKFHNGHNRQTFVYLRGES